MNWKLVLTSLAAGVLIGGGISGVAVWDYKDSERQHALPIAATKGFVRGVCSTRSAPCTGTVLVQDESGRTVESYEIARGAAYRNESGGTPSPEPTTLPGACTGTLEPYEGVTGSRNCQFAEMVVTANPYAQ
jgi:hypothetical protein